MIMSYAIFHMKYGIWFLSVRRHLRWAVEVGGERAATSFFHRCHGDFDQRLACACDAQFISADLADHRASQARLLRDVFYIGDMLGFQADDDARRRFAEEQGRRVADTAQFRVFAQVDARADRVPAVARKTALGQRYSQSAVAAIVRRTD